MQTGQIKSDKTNQIPSPAMYYFSDTDKMYSIQSHHTVIINQKSFYFSIPFLIIPGLEFVCLTAAATTTTSSFLVKAVQTC